MLFSRQSDQLRSLCSHKACLQVSLLCWITVERYGLNCRIPCHSKTHLESVATRLRSYTARMLSGYVATWLRSYTATQLSGLATAWRPGHYMNISRSLIHKRLFLFNIIIWLPFCQFFFSFLLSLSSHSMILYNLLQEIVHCVVCSSIFKII